MKHWGELTELESAIIRVGEFKNIFKLLVAGSENYVDIKVLQSAIYTLEGMIDDIDSTLYEKFETVFNVVRDESFSEEEEYRFENGQEFKDTFTVSALDPEYGDHGGGSTMADYPELNTWQHTVNQISKFNK
jgi:hypothetical protein